MNAANDTIVAPATPSGESALAVVRLSGPAVPELSQALLHRSSPLPPRRATVASLYNREGEILDRVVVTYYPVNHSFTKEDLLEISLHGNPVLVQKVVEDCIRRGARPALPGEFTRRAFLNGSLDLTQAEAVADLIHARSDFAIRLAQQLLRGDLGLWISRQSQALLEAIARLEAYIDFPEEDLPPEDQEGPLRQIQELRKGMANALRLSRYRDLVQDGVKTIIIGPPNAGKSSLINQLLGEERALVSPEPGTTRDYIRERLRLGPYCIQILDTAGLREARADLERRGIEKTLELAAEADFFLLILDGTTAPPSFPEALERNLKPENTLILENKTDLADFQPCPDFIPHCRHHQISLLTGTGWQSFIDTWCDLLKSRAFTPPEEAILLNARHTQALVTIDQHLAKSLDLSHEGEGVEWIVAELRLALDAFGEILGKVDNEQMLDILFKNFCIGK